MASQCLYPAHVRIFPHNYGIIRIAVGADQFVRVFAEGEVAHLGLSLDALEFAAQLRVPGTDAAVSGAATGDEESALVG